MVKEAFISYMKEGSPNLKDIIIREYCLEFNKKEEDIDTLITILSFNPFLKMKCYDIAMDYFFTKFEITILADKNGIIKDIY